MLLALLSLSFAADPIDPFKEADESDQFRFEEQLVTVASRYAQTVQKAPSIVEVVTDEQIRQRGYRVLSDVLRDLPGIYVWRSVEGRDLAAMRGVISADNNKLLVLVDGQPWYDGVYTNALIDEYMPISHIRQVEVIKGPGSAIYGTNAFSGVVNIVTYGGRDLQGGRVRWVAGAHGRSDITATAGGTAELGAIEASMSVYARSLSALGQGLGITPDGDIDIPNTDPKSSINVGGRLVLEDLFDIGDLKTQVHHVDYQHTYLFNGQENPYEAQGKELGDFALGYRNTFVDVRWGMELSRDVTLTPYLFSQYHDNGSAYFFGGDITVDPDDLTASQFLLTVDAEKTTRRWGTGLDVEARPGIDHVVVGGVGVENTTVLKLYDQAFLLDGDPFVFNNFGAFDNCGQVVGLPGNGRDCGNPRLLNIFGFAQYTWTVTPSFELVAGARVDKRVPMNDGEQGDDGVFVLQASPRAGVLLVPTDRSTLKLLYGRAIRAPNVRELLVVADQDPTTGVYAFSSGNINLVPENINTVEMEARNEFVEGFSLRVDGSYSQVNNEIDKVDPGIYCNLPGALRIVAGEVGIDAAAGPIRAQSTYALTFASYAEETAFDPDVCDFVWADPYGGRQQYEFPPHMVKSRLGILVTDQLQVWTLNELYSKRPRSEWSPDGGMEDGDALALFHLGVTMSDIGKNDRFRVGASVRNLLDTQWNYGVYRDDANEPDLTSNTGFRRMVSVDLEAQF